ncbi:MAG: hypothetical protein HY690_04430 [Chloroflexi bacterium]|nr:hypothetical protein [Chloroflexota bacterium]
MARYGPYAIPTIMGYRPRRSAVVAILGDDPVVGQALEILLQGAGHDVRFLPGAALDWPGELMANAQLVLLAPGLSLERREALLGRVRRMSGRQSVPCLELTSVAAGAPSSGCREVRWPCQVVTLLRAVDAAVGGALPGEGET